MVEILFFDSYALFEILLGNPRYLERTNKVAMITTKLNLLEVHHAILRVKGENDADNYFQGFEGFTVEIDNEVLKNASKLKSFYKQKKLSYIDCVGYALAQSRGIKFLTGDKEFKDMENVEFIT